jgi:hypothetical protein
MKRYATAEVKDFGARNQLKVVNLENNVKPNLRGDKEKSRVVVGIGRDVGTKGYPGT